MSGRPDESTSRWKAVDWRRPTIAASSRVVVKQENKVLGVARRERKWNWRINWGYVSSAKSSVLAVVCSSDHDRLGYFEQFGNQTTCDTRPECSSDIPIEYGHGERSVLR